MGRSPQDEALVNYLLDETVKGREKAAGYRLAKVIDDSPLTLEFAGNTAVTVEATRLTSYTPTINDRVLVLVLGNDLIVLGEPV